MFFFTLVSSTSMPIFSKSYISRSSGEVILKYSYTCTWGMWPSRQSFSLCFFLVRIAFKFRVYERLVETFTITLNCIDYIYIDYVHSNVVQKPWLKVNPPPFLDRCVINQTNTTVLSISSFSPLFSIFNCILQTIDEIASHSRAKFWKGFLRYLNLSL